jgi:hypothetical protein
MTTIQAKKEVKKALDAYGIPFNRLTAKTENSFLCTQTQEPYVSVEIHADKPHPNFSDAKASVPPGILFLPKIPNVIQG